MKTGCSSETLVPTYQTTRLHNPEDGNMMRVFVHTRFNVAIREKISVDFINMVTRYDSKCSHKKNIENYYKQKINKIVFAFLLFE
jgi:hypothetical protein